ncbi:MAG: pyridine nucleotide-disulfide oxidoreductase [Nitrospirae bacterium]|nr:pyridine nucleotide-disulfide oxidoreductase [Nitrospirota bacterium]
MFSLCTIAIIAWGWLGRDQSGLTAESGTGYALGIIGAVTMILLLLYPMRKRLSFMRRWGSVPVWFSTHMIMGIIAPVCILFHANFQLGSLNSNVALISTLTVAGSGIIGRFIYTKVHYGLYGGRVTLNALREDALTAKGRLSAEFAFAPQLRARLQAFEDRVLAPARNPLHGLVKVMVLGMRVRATRLRLSRFMSGAVRLKARQAGWTWRERRRNRRDARRFLSVYLRTVRQVAELGFYERLFSFWHVLHLPLFFMLVVAGVMHVVAVHMY